ncbi:MAG: ABC transporter permease, partial [Planctomycetota bacterium]|jgi:ABC-type antimicrobial peptide transport system permease subunit
MLMSVTERFQEIGTMKCLGAMDGFIIKIFMIEAFIQGAFGTTVGLIVGLIISVILSIISYGVSPVFSALPLFDIVFAAILSFVIGVGLCTVFAIYPAYFASTMQPVEAMRVEE